MHPESSDNNPSSMGKRIHRFLFMGPSSLLMNTVKYYRYLGLVKTEGPFPCLPYSFAHFQRNISLNKTREIDKKNSVSLTIFQTLCVVQTFSTTILLIHIPVLLQYQLLEAVYSFLGNTESDMINTSPTIS